MDMTVGIAELKSRLSYYLGLVRDGRPVTVLDRTRPVARIVPYGAMASPVAVRERKVKSKTLADFKPLPRLVLPKDIMRYL
ncbi:MAG: type II toxin-antitoxin system prevent-host-death family antitoxin, partial [Longimicrobiales bacterium]